MKRIFCLIVMSATLLNGPVQAFGQQVVENVPLQGIRATYKAGQKAFEKGDYDEAISCFEKALERIQQKSVMDNDFFAAVFCALSSAYYEKGVFPYYHFRDLQYFAKSTEFATQCLRFKPDATQAYENLGKVYLKLEEYDKADYYYSLAEKLTAPGSRGAAYLARQRKKIQGVKKLKESKNLKKVIPGDESPYKDYPVLENPPVPAFPSKTPNQ